MQCTATTLTKASDHSYDQFLVNQKKRQMEGKATREAKRTKVQSTTATTIDTVDDQPDVDDRVQEDSVALLHQQLAAKTEECRHLTIRLQNIEEINAKILSNQIAMQETFVKVA